MKSGRTDGRYAETGERSVRTGTSYAEIGESFAGIGATCAVMSVSGIDPIAPRGPVVGLAVDDNPTRSGKAKAPGQMTRGFLYPGNDLLSHPGQSGPPEVGE